ncbi:MAG TPA: MFS transporter [Casimicrobiaceae bacterium]|nr:MFS transporter [Casimicrobiaceae bacterium]
MGETRRALPADGRVGTHRRRHAPGCGIDEIEAVAARSDRLLIYVASLLRGLAAGTISVLGAIYLAKRGFDEAAIGLVLSAGLAGVLAGTVYGTYFADRAGRRRTLVLLAVLSATGAGALVVADALWAAALAAFVGMLNTQGSDRGAAQALEQAMLPATASDAERTQVFARYNAVADIGGAVGALLAALPTLLQARFELTEVRAYDATIFVYAGLALAAAALYARLSSSVERAAAPDSTHATDHAPTTRRAVRKFSLLAAVDAMGGGFIGSALIAYFLYARFGVEEGALALLFVAARTMTVLSHFAAAWLAARIGLVNTMVFTHIPSSLLLLTLPIAPTFGVAAALFILREGLSEMDVPTRQSYLMAIVPPHERSWAAGISQLARAAGRMVSPLLAGVAMQAGALWLPLAVAALVKVTYDVALWRAFREIKPPEEQASRR